MKKTLALTLSLAFVMVLATGCANNPPQTTVSPTLAPTVRPAEPNVPDRGDVAPAPGITDPLVSPGTDILPDTSPHVNPGTSPGLTPDNGVGPDTSPRVSPGAEPGTSPNVSPAISPGTSPGTGHGTSPSPSITPQHTGASVNPEAPSDIAALADASEIASAAAEQQNVQRAVAVQLNHMCVIGITIRSGKKYNQAIEDAVLAAARKKDDAIAYFVTADKVEVETLYSILDTWGNPDKEESNKSEFNKLAEKLKDAVEAKEKQA